MGARCERNRNPSNENGVATNYRVNQCQDTQPWYKQLSCATLLFLGMVTLGGCSTTQLKDQTVGVGRTIGSIYTSQVLENLHSMIQNKNAVPSHFSMKSGSIYTGNAVKP